MKDYLLLSSPPGNRQGFSRIMVFCLSALLVLSFSSAVVAQSTVSGVITSVDDNSPLPGVSILVKGTSTGTTSDANGAYTVTVPGSDAILVFSFIGYTPQEMTVNAQTTINISLAPDLTELTEVVVVGYGTVNKKDLTGAVAVVDNEQISRRSSVGPLEALQGQVAGVDISNANGRAGAGFNIQIRGVQSFEGGQPLYVVDGVIVPDGIGFLNPQDIERMDVLKDASSTAIYGSRGAYGVVIVTTKGGASQKSKAVISYDGYTGVRKVSRMPDFMDGQTWWNWRQDSFISDAIVKGQTIPTNPGYNTTTGELQRRIDENDYTNWPSLITQDGKQQNHFLTLSGRGDKVGYTFGFGYQNEEGNVIGENYERYNFKASIDHTLSEHWSGGMSVNIGVATNDMGSPNVMVEGFRMVPLMSPYDTETGAMLIQPGKDAIGSSTNTYHIDFTSSVNPLVEVEKAWVQQTSNTAIGNIYLEYSPKSWLSFKTTFAPLLSNRRVGQFVGTNAEGNVNGLPQGRVDKFQSFSYVWDNQVNFTKVINDHNISAMGLFSANAFVDESNFIQQLKMVSSARNFYTVGKGGDATSISGGGDWAKETLASFALRVNYAFKDKYLLTLSNRADGSSKLAEGNKWDMFPSAAVAWKLSEESFMTGASFVNALKIRASYGETGNNRVGRYSTIPFASTATYYDFDNTNAPGVAPNGIASQAITWEKTKEFDFGVDFELFTSRITGTIDVYHKKSEDLLVKKAIPFENGYLTVWSNAGEVLNKGVEVSLTTTNISTSKVTWTTSFNFAKNNNEVIEVYGGTDRFQEVRNDGYAADDWVIKGESLGSYYNWVADGVWQAGDTDAATYSQLEGQGRVVDYNNDGKIQDNDKRIIGSTLPKWTAGFNSTLNFLGFDLSVAVITRQGVTAYSPFHAEFTNHEDRGRAKLDIDWYMQDNDITETRTSNFYPQPKNAGNYWRQFSVGYYRDASFVKVKNITLGYTIPATLLERMKITSLRVYATALNPIVITDYDGFDPEWASSTFTSNGTLTQSFSQGAGLGSTTYLLGVNLKF